MSLTAPIGRLRASNRHARRMWMVGLRPDPPRSPGTRHGQVNATRVSGSGTRHPARFRPETRAPQVCAGACGSRRRRRCCRRRSRLPRPDRAARPVSLRCRERSGERRARHTRKVKVGPIGRRGRRCGSSDREMHAGRWPARPRPGPSATRRPSQGRSRPPVTEAAVR